MNPENNMIFLPCNLCASDRFRVLYDQCSRNPDLSGLEAKMTTDIYGVWGRVVKCLECGLVYQNPRYPDQDVLSAYASMEDSDYCQEQDCRSINAHLSLKMIRRYRSQGKFLDVGCSTGFLLNAARLDFDTHGVELSRWAARFAREKLLLNVSEGTLDSVPLESSSFDVVSLVDFIEHVTDPKKTLEQAARLLKPQGLLYLVTPDIESFSSRLLGQYWWGLRPAHLYYFSRTTMVEMLRRVGLTVLEQRSYGRIFSYSYWISRLKNYPRFLRRWPELAVRRLGLEDKVLYLNTRDSMEICVTKEPV